MPSYTSEGGTRPKIDCGNATAFVPVVVFEKGNESSVELENFCVTVKAPSRYELLQLKDRMIYSLLGILK